MEQPYGHPTMKTPFTFLKTPYTFMKVPFAFMNVPFTFIVKDLYIRNGLLVETPMEKDGRAIETPDNSSNPLSEKTDNRGDNWIRNVKKGNDDPMGTLTDWENQEVIDAEGLYVLPGLIDVHSHGACGFDFSDGNPEGLAKILAYEAANGITSYCPTSMTLPPQTLERAFAQICDAPQGRGYARLAGIHMEGPFLDPVKKGAHKKEFLIPPDIGLFREWNAQSKGLIRLVTLAPNLPGSMEFIRQFSNEVHISLGHTATDYRTAREAFAAGADHVTHLFNAMSPFGHREPGLIGAAAENEQCMAELICDGVHIHESMVRAAFRLFPGRIVLISDSIRAAGLSDGIYELGGQQVNVQGKHATLADGTIAGSVSNLFDCMRTAISFGIPAEEAVAAATANPAKSIGIYDIAGSLTPGKRADLLLVDKNWRLIKVFQAGEELS